METNKELYDALEPDMSIQIDKFLQCFKRSSINKDTIIPALKLSAAYNYNKNKDCIELRNKPANTIVEINLNNNKNNSFTESKEKLEKNL